MARVITTTVLRAIHQAGYLAVLVLGDLTMGILPIMEAYEGIPVLAVITGVMAVMAAVLAEAMVVVIAVVLAEATVVISKHGLPYQSFMIRSMKSLRNWV